MPFSTLSLQNLISFLFSSNVYVRSCQTDQTQEGISQGSPCGQADRQTRMAENTSFGTPLVGGKNVGTMTFSTYIILFSSQNGLCVDIFKQICFVKTNSLKKFLCVQRRTKYSESKHFNSFVLRNTS